MQINRVQYTPKFGNLMIKAGALDKKSLMELDDVQKAGETLDGTDAHLVLESDGSRSIITPTGEKLKSDSITVEEPYSGWGHFYISAPYKDSKGEEHTYKKCLDFPCALLATQAYNRITGNYNIYNDIEIVKLLHEQNQRDKKRPEEEAKQEAIPKECLNIAKSLYETYPYKDI